jgi:CRP-like cAMP-binding protein
MWITDRPASGAKADGKLAAMSALPLFEGCSSQTLRELGQCFDTSEVKAGATFEHEGDPARWLSVILRGAVLLTSEARAQRVLGTGDCWGFEGLSDRRRCQNAVMALTPVTLLIVDRRSFHRVEQCSARVADALRQPSNAVTAVAGHVPRLAARPSERPPVADQYADGVRLTMSAGGRR